MTYKEIAEKLTGFRFPIYTVSCNPSRLEMDIARELFFFLEERKVLYTSFQPTLPAHCIQAVANIGDFSAGLLTSLQPVSALSDIVCAMHNACQRFLTLMTTHNYYYWKLDGTIDNDLSTEAQILLYTSFGEFRGTMGMLTAKLMVMHGIDCNSGLLAILPIDVGKATGLPTSRGAVNKAAKRKQASMIC